MPGVVISRIVDLAQCLIRWVDLRSCLLGGVTGNIADEDGSVIQELSELAICDDQCTECA